MRTAEKAKEFLEIVDLLKKRLDQLQEETPEDTDDYHRLFLYFVGEQFEGISPEKLQICDRKGDQKIDFYDAGEDRFVAYQCKLPELESLEEKKSVAPFNADLVIDVEDILSFLTDGYGSATGNEACPAGRETNIVHRSRSQR